MQNLRFKRKERKFFMKTFLELIKENEGENAIGKVYSYHEPNSWIIDNGGFEAFCQTAEGEEATDKTIYIGAELEIGLTKDQSQSERKAILKRLMETIPCILEHDSSITSGANKYVYQDVEIITAPMTIKRWLELAPDIERIFKELADFGYESHNLGSCGLHFHYTLIDRDNKSKIVNRYWHQMHTWEQETHKIAGRGYVGYAHDLNCDDALVPEEKMSISYIDKKVKQQGDGPCSDHSSAINLQHENDIEIRICRGTLNAKTFMARLEFFYNMYIQACSLNVITQRMTWNKLVNSKYIKQYVTQQNIATLKKAYDYSTKIQVLEKQLIKYDDKLLNCIIDTIKECKMLQANGKKMQELSISYELTNLMDYLTATLTSLSKRFMKDDSLKNAVKRYMTTYGYNRSAGEREMKKLLQPLYEILEDRPTLNVDNAPIESDI